MEYYKKILEVGSREAIPVADGRLAFGQAVKDGHWIPEPLLDKFHPTPLGHEYLARSLCDAILKLRGAEVAGK
jgi:lysophospholipase L1-like esterase